MKKESTLMAAIGRSAIPVVPITDFTKAKFTEEQFNEIWSIVGVSAEKNLNTCPLWKVICMAYIEGLNHGAGLKS